MVMVVLNCNVVIVTLHKTGENNKKQFLVTYVLQKLKTIVEELKLHAIQIPYGYLNSRV